MGCTVKLLAICERAADGGSVTARVHPAMIPLSHPLASVREAYNAVFVEAEAAGQLMFYGPGAGGAPTASAVLGDLVAVCRNKLAGPPGPASPRTRSCRCSPMGDVVTRYHISLDVADKPGVLAQVATVFAEHGVSIDTVRQQGQGRRGLPRRRHPPRARRRPRRRPSRRCASSTPCAVSPASCGWKGSKDDRIDHREVGTHQWRGIIEEYRDRLPVTDTTRRSSRCREGGTPLVPAQVLSERTGCEVHLKVEGANPTGSFKDRGMTMAITKAKEEGAQAVICASTGNTSRLRRRLRGAGRDGLRRAGAAGQDRARQDGPGAGARREDPPGRRQLRRLPRPGPRAVATTTRWRWSIRSTRCASRARRPPPSRSSTRSATRPTSTCCRSATRATSPRTGRATREYAADGIATPHAAHVGLPGVRLRADRARRGRQGPARPSPPRSGSATRRPGSTRWPRGTSRAASSTR